MTIDMSQFYQVFFEETAEHLSTMESLLLRLDLDAPDIDDLNAIFRAAHSIKGGSGTFGFTDLTEVTHILETLLDRIRKGETAITTEMVDAFLEAGDVLKELLEAHQNGSQADESRSAAVCAKLEQLTEASTLQPPAERAPPPQVSQPTENVLYTYRVKFSKDPKAFPDAASLDNLLEDLANLGQVQKKRVNAKSVSLSLETPAQEAELRDIFSFFLAPEQLEIQQLSASTTETEDPGYGFFDEPAQPAASSTDEDGYGFFVDSGTLRAQVEEADGYGFFVEPATVRAQVEDEQGYGFFTDVEPSGSQQAPTPTPSSPPASTTPKPAAAKTKDNKTAANSGADSSIRVSVEKVDQMINLVGELVITQAMLAQTASDVDPVLYERLLTGLAQLERNTRDLQEAVMSIRMMPISFVFSRFPRVVRDLAGKLSKKVQLKTIGEGTELDKGLIEKISDPLNHLVRNSLDHGIESPDQRKVAGKDPQGTITLKAAHQGGNIVIEVIDDGGGLNRDKILAKAREKGLPVHDTMSDGEVWQLIFAPGFSTAAAVTDVSGRGVGMDVVKRNIESLGGRVEISSEYGHGTTITIRLPLTLAILDGLSIAVGKETYIIPLTFIIESLQPTAGDIRTVTGQGRVVNVRGDYLPLIPLHEVFRIKARAGSPQEGILVIIEADGQKAALSVDELLGQHQVVIKSLESNYRKVPGVSGATIMGDGRVAMILDVTGLVKLSQNR